MTAAMSCRIVPGLDGWLREDLSPVALGHDRLRIREGNEKAPR